MDEKNKLTVPKTIVTTGKGDEKSIVAGKTQITSTSAQLVEGSNEVDIVFVFDTTGSMEDKIEGLKQTCDKFVGETKTLDLKPQFALISFGDISIQGGGDKIEVVVPPTDNIEKIRSGLRNIPRNNGFGNSGESCLEALEEALKLGFRPKAVKVIILITDEPALQHQIKADDMTKRLKEREFLAFVLATNETYYKDIALKNGGVWKEISSTTDLSEILAMFRDIAKKVSQIAKNVHLLGHGSVKRYLELKPPEK